MIEALQVVLDALVLFMVAWLRRDVKRNNNNGKSTPA